MFLCSALQKPVRDTVSSWQAKILTSNRLQHKQRAAGCSWSPFTTALGAGLTPPASRLGGEMVLPQHWHLGLLRVSTHK